MKRHNHGFTLIELIVVIVILGILAVSAAPKFMNLQSDARKAALESLKGSLTSTAQMVYGKAIIAGKEKSYEMVNGKKTGKSEYICLDSLATADCTSSSPGAIEIRYGHPAAKPNGILKAMDLDAVEAGGDVSGHDWAYRHKTWTDGTNNSQILLGFPNATDRIPFQYEDSQVSTYGDKCFLLYDTPSIETVGIETNGIRILIFSGGC